MPVNPIDSILATFDTSVDQIDEGMIDTEILKLKPENDDDWEEPDGWLAERIAFSFSEGDSGNCNQWFSFKSKSWWRKPRVFRLFHS